MRIKIENLFGIIIVLIISCSANALEVDDKLTMRILKTSDSAKTVLINRGIEDGLAKGDHAKFFLTIGIVARGVVEKVSPTRSVWSLYRIVNAGYLKNDVVMNLKITNPVKMTEDSTKMIVKDDPLPKDSSVGIPLAVGADDRTTDRAELAALGASMPGNVEIPERNVEVLGMLQLSSLSGSSEADETSTEAISGSTSHMDFLLGVDFYFKDTNKWYSNFSFMPFYHIEDSKMMTGSGQSTNTKYTEYGLALNWHPFKPHYATKKLIIFFNGSMGMGKSTDSYEMTSGTQGDSTDTLNGTINFWSIGSGVKFFLPNGFGARMTMDYFVRGIQYDDVDMNDITWVQNMSGFRLYAGLGYRF